MKILKSGRNCIDVFKGEGWYQWSKYKIVKSVNGYKLRFISGIKLRHAVVKLFEDSLDNKKLTAPKWNFLDGKLSKIDKEIITI